MTDEARAVARQEIRAVAPRLGERAQRFGAEAAREATAGLEERLMSKLRAEFVAILEGRGIPAVGSKRVRFQGGSEADSEAGTNDVGEGGAM